MNIDELVNTLVYLRISNGTTEFGKLLMIYFRESQMIERIEFFYFGSTSLRRIIRLSD